ncbi:MAG: hypothetical protein U0166_24585 [Acidobacteriota bacterium]
MDDVLAWEDVRADPRRLRGVRALGLVQGVAQAGARDPRTVFPGGEARCPGLLHEDRKDLLHGHEPLDTDDAHPALEGEAWLMRRQPRRPRASRTRSKVPRPARW